MNILIVDDESLARSRLRTLLGNIHGVERIAEAASATQAHDILRQTGESPFDIVLLDIQMPGMNGLAFARSLQGLAHSPAIIFVTAHAEFACQAFDLEAADYLTKPVRQERLQQALCRAARLLPLQQTHTNNVSIGMLAAAEDAPFVTVNERGRIERVILDTIIFCKAEQKYVTLQTHQKTYLYDGSLNELEGQFPQFFLRIHRNALAARKYLRDIQKTSTTDEAELWLLGMLGTEEKLIISRRQLAAVRAALQGKP